MVWYMWYNFIDIRVFLKCPVDYGEAVGLTLLQTPFFSPPWDKDGEAKPPGD